MAAMMSEQSDYGAVSGSGNDAIQHPMFVVDEDVFIVTTMIRVCGLHVTFMMITEVIGDLYTYLIGTNRYSRFGYCD